ncbi:MAG: ilvE [Gammaproteobacteria bacterium]|jgi:branched-chain amino acid aminotransferase|nr:ilvE [Gammaproteobacteria bacterium]
MHVQKTSLIWQNGEFIPWEKATTHVLTHGLHYGSGIFEGIRFYATESGPAIFRLQCHMERFLYSAAALKMTLPFSLKMLSEAIVKLVRETGLSEGYIRPIAYYNADIVGVHPKGAKTDVAIACWPWGKYLPKGKIAVKTSSFMRIHPKSTICDAKISGHYVNSILALQEISNTPYQEVLLLDADGYVAEGSAANVFIVKDNTLFTPTKGSILPGITRETVLELAKEYQIDAIEKKITLEEVYNADEAFFCGTAVEINPFHSVDDKPIGKGETGPITEQITSLYHDAVRGKLPRFDHYLCAI